jgi:5-methylcytosine-specific restriction endonuclease McrA
MADMDVGVRPKRKAITRRVKRLVLDRQKHHCAHCRALFLMDDGMQFDHRPALEQRPVNDAGTDYIPPQLDPDFIEGLHDPCHDERTFGRKAGAAKTVTTKGSDAWRAAKFRKLEGKNKQRPRQKIRSRGFGEQSRPFQKKGMRP